MDRLDLTRQLRACTERHYNCCQSVLIPFCPELGMDRETAYRLGFPFGAGMRVGEACGALTGGLMVLGLLGCTEEESLALIDRFRQRHSCLDCRDLLAANEARGCEKKPHCDALVLDMVRDIDHWLQTRG